MELRVVFHLHPDVRLDDVLELCRERYSFRRRRTASGVEQVSVTFDQDSLDAFDRVADAVAALPGVRFEINGEPVELDRLRRFLDCYRCRCRAADRRAYCAGQGWRDSECGPVRQLFPCRMIPVGEGNDTGWFRFGRLARDGTFIVDKQALRRHVYAALRESLAIHCPALFPADIEAVIQALPSRIDPRSDEGWAYRYGWDNGTYRVIGVEKRRLEGGAPAPPPEGPSRPAPGGMPPAPADGAAAPAAGHGAAAPAGAAAGEGGSRARPAGARAGEDATRGAEAGGPFRPEAGVDGRNVPRVRYADIGGLHAQIQRLRETVELPLRRPDVFRHLGVTPHRGVLLYGPPGTGKTLLAKALASECNAHFILVNGPELLSKWHGESEANLRKVFAEARQKQPSVILVDEIDALAPARDRVSHSFEAVFVSQLLALLDGLEERGQVVVVGTTNRPDAVDPALRRPGRLDLLLEVGLPDRAARLEILRIHTRGMPLGPDVDLAAIADQTEGWSGADLAGLCREAALCCLREHLDWEAADVGIPPERLGAIAVGQRHLEAARQWLAALRLRRERPAGGPRWPRGRSRSRGRLT